MSSQPHISADSYSRAAFPVNAYFHEQRLGTATAFFWRTDSGLFLITNWHVVTGRNAATLRHLDSRASEPNALEYTVYSLNGDSKVIRVPLYDNDRPIWIVHPEWRRQVDIAAIKVEDQSPVFMCRPINELPETSLATRIGMQLFILGFPFGTHRRPVWKAATIASEPDVALFERRAMLVDSLSRPGMSGSPVIQRAWGTALTETERHDPSDENSPMRLEMKAHHIPATKLIGIYSGRLRTNDQEDAQLGIVWRRHLIEAVIASSLCDDHPQEQTPVDEQDFIKF